MGGSAITANVNDVRAHCGSGTVYDPTTLNFAATGTLRAGFPEPVTVSLASDTPGVGTIVSPDVTFMAGDSSKTTAAFDPVGPGTTILRITGPPSGFSPPSKLAKVQQLVAKTEGAKARKVKKLLAAANRLLKSLKPKAAKSAARGRIAAGCGSDIQAQIDAIRQMLSGLGQRR